MKCYILIFFTVLFFCQTQAQKKGCPDPVAINYDSTATQNDGSCSYTNISVKPAPKFNLNTALNETSGLLYWKKKIWTHNDSGGDAVLFQLNNSTGIIENTIIISNATNTDWEDLAQDDVYIYIGDFGNNTNGNRTDLKIYKVAKADILSGNTITASVISYDYSDQTDFTPKGSNNTNFDCEAMIAFGDSLFLFSKNWVDNKTKLYKLPKTPGNHIAEKIGELNVQGLISGADIVPEQRVILLSGYNMALAPFVYLLYDFTGNDFLSANKRKVQINQSFTQVEGICTVTPAKFYISNERYKQLFISTPVKLQTLNLTTLLGPYYQSMRPLHKKNPQHIITRAEHQTNRF